MAALLDLHPEGTHPVLAGVAEIEPSLDRMHAGAAAAAVAGEYRRGDGVSTGSVAGSRL